MLPGRFLKHTGVELRKVIHRLLYFISFHFISVRFRGILYAYRLTQRDNIYMIMIIYIYINTYIYIPVVPHKAVAEVSKIGSL